MGWCDRYEREVLRVTRGELDLYVRHLEARGYAPATVARRLGTVASFYRYVVIVALGQPAQAVTRAKVAWEGQHRTVLHPLEFAAGLSASRASGPNDHALVCLLGMLGLRVPCRHRGPALRARGLVCVSAEGFLCRGRVSGSVPADRAGDDGWLAVCVVAVRWLLWSSAGWEYGWSGFPVVVGSLGGVVQHRVGGEDLLQCRVGEGAL